ncbi:sulfite exporter TauE/SafE family protein [Synechocystis sp. B12]|nr:sulfite exporter TauE/SafE family protein [Synechocystis sp. B12]
MKQGTIDLQRLPKLIIITLISSAIGAGLLFVVPSKSLPQLVSFFMIVVVIFSFLNRKSGIKKQKKYPRVSNGWVTEQLLF